MPPAEEPVGVKSIAYFFRLILVVKEVCFVILVSVRAIMSNTLFVHLSRWSRSSKFLFKEHALIWNKARDLCLLGNFKVWIWSMA